MKNDILKCINAIEKFKQAVEKDSKKLRKMEQSMLNDEYFDDIIKYLEKEHIRFFSKAFIIPVPVGSIVYRKDGEWLVCGYDCDQTGQWRIKLKKCTGVKLGLPEYNRPLVTSMNKSFFETAEDRDNYYTETGKGKA